MAVLGLLLIIAVGVAAGGLIEGGRSVEADTTAYGMALTGLSEAGLMLVGAILGIGLAVGFALLASGTRRARRDARIRRAEQTAKVRKAEQLESERDELAARLEEERAGRHRAEQAIATSSSGAEWTTSVDGDTYPVDTGVRDHEVFTKPERARRG